MSNHRRKRRRLKPRIRRRAAPGTAPGTLEAPPGALPTAIGVFAYDKEHVFERNDVRPDDLPPMLAQWSVVWVNVVGLGNVDLLKQLADIFHIHPLAMEDVVHVHQRAKADQFEQNVYCVMRMPDAASDELTVQLSLVLGKKYVVTFQERPGDCFDLVRARLRHELSVIRQETQADFLAYRLIDAVVDAYFPIMESMGDQLDSLDDRATSLVGQTAFSELHIVRRELLMLRRAIWPLRDAIRELQVEPTSCIGDQTRLYLRDCQDHAIQLIDLLEAYRDVCGDIRDFHMSAISNRMNEVMKTLTVISTIFLPLTFIVGLYGMNFNTASPWNMPELNWRYGYLFVWALMILITIIMLAVFKRYGWLERDPSLEEHSADGNPHDGPPHPKA